MLLFNENRNIYSWYESCKDEFNNNKKFLWELNTIKKLHDKSNDDLLSPELINYITQNNKIINLVIGSIMPDVTAEEKSVCLNSELLHQNILPTKDFNFSYQVTQTVERPLTSNILGFFSNRTLSTYVEEQNHAGLLANQHSMLAEFNYDEKYKFNKELNKSNGLITIFDCMLHRILLAKQWWINNIIMQHID